MYLIRQDDGEITIDDFTAIINDLQDAKNLKTKDVFLDSAEADYFYENDQTMIRLDKKQRLIEITGLGKASIRAVCEIQKRFAHPLRLFDMDYTFDINLDKAIDFEELKNKMDVEL